MAFETSDAGTSDIGRAFRVACCPPKTVRLQADSAEITLGNPRKITYTEHMKSLTRTYVINAPVSRVWNALVDPEIIDVWGGGPAKMNAKKGSDFSLWGGDIHGTNTGVIEGELLEQDWYGGDWEKPSRVSFRLLAVSPDKTKVTLAQSEIPDTEFDDIADGWKRYYLGPLKALLEK